MSMRTDPQNRMSLIYTGLMTPQGLKSPLPQFYAQLYQSAPHEGHWRQQIRYGYGLTV